MCRPRPGIRCEQRGSELLKSASKKAVLSKQAFETKQAELDDARVSVETGDGRFSQEDVDKLQAELTPLQEQAEKDKQQYYNELNEWKQTSAGIAASQAIADDPTKTAAERTEAEADALKAAEIAAERKHVAEMLNDPELSDKERWVLGSREMERQSILIKQSAAAIERAKMADGKLALKQLTMKQALVHGLSKERYERLLYKRMQLFKQGKLAESDLKFRGVFKAAITSWMERRLKNAGNLAAQTSLWSLSMTEKLAHKVIHYTTGARRGSHTYHGKWGDVMRNDRQKQFERSLGSGMIPRTMAQESEDMVDNVKIAEAVHEKTLAGADAARERMDTAWEKEQERLRLQAEREAREAERQARAAQPEPTKPVTDSSAPLVDEVPNTDGSPSASTAGPTPDKPEN